jgi:hypothetical protein
MHRNRTLATSKSHTHCLAAHSTHIQSKSISVLSVVSVEKVGKEKCPTARLTKKD